ncbi:hypothetical protein J4470_00950 [Candidatus Woesearchaeota archaeon]|nr:hypothetical protein [Candidatus Woesearchaeota archaeon]
MKEDEIKKFFEEGRRILAHRKTAVDIARSYGLPRTVGELMLKALLSQHEGQTSEREADYGREFGEDTFGAECLLMASALAIVENRADSARTPSKLEDAVGYFSEAVNVARTSGGWCVYIGRKSILGLGESFEPFKDAVTKFYDTAMQHERA